jgi:GMP synthase-like glutamine amidotransferase
MKLHYLQHVPFETPGVILDWAVERNWNLTTTALFQSGTGKVAFPNTKDFDWLVIMGGPMNSCEDAAYPWLKDEKAFIRTAVEAGKTVLGICLGAQLLAGALGGTVTRNRKKEIGWLPVFLHEAARAHPLFAPFPAEPVVFQWHGDTFSQLPPGAIPLAGSGACQNQAFMYGERAFGFQFHLESTQASIEALLTNCWDDLTPGDYVQTPEELLSHPEHIEENNRLMRGFLDRLAE